MNKENRGKVWKTRIFVACLILLAPFIGAGFGLAQDVIEQIKFQQWAEKRTLGM